jgi:hypothetical protein
MPDLLTCRRVATDGYRITFGGKVGSVRSARAMPITANTGVGYNEAALVWRTCRLFSLSASRRRLAFYEKRRLGMLAHLSSTDANVSCPERPAIRCRTNRIVDPTRIPTHEKIASTPSGK